MSCMIQRDRELATLRGMLRRHPAVGIIGAGQVGKTTLARILMRGESQPIHLFDLESPEDLARLAEPTLALKPLRGLVVIDEIQPLR
ncbi:AAA family ATPase [Candidatus Methylomirabilis sp.]|uniref:AAA family ATPase n=1 Tax=Candidatus Methylomirabilis tolerans TaxID=3123416 RepID=A0AAJ1AIP4_9BACT|nr:AAA family ATPase [Candidatus Methylomirabilis sp.]